MCLKKYCILLILCAFIGVSCDDNDTACSEDVSVGLGVKNYEAVYDSTTATYSTSSYSPSLVLKGLGQDSLLIDSVATNSYYLPLSLDTNFTSFVLNATDRGVVDTLTIYHTNIKKLISVACGCKIEYIIKDLTFTSHALDSISLTDTVVNNRYTNHLALYYQPQ